MIRKKKVLIAPLDWGLGHATRCIPVIRQLLDADLEVIAAAEGSAAFLLHEAFPQMHIVPLRGYRLKYSSSLPAWMKVVFEIPRILLRMRLEHAALKRIVREQAIDVVISDNRFGLWHPEVRSVYITHQVMIKCPRGFRFLEPLLSRMHRRIMKNFSRCWIPDFPGSENLSGDLSHRYALPEQAVFIGPLSRFSRDAASADIEYEYCFILSGPEPSRTTFEKKILALAGTVQGKSVVILGTPGIDSGPPSANVLLISHADSASLRKIINSSRYIICRSGYSSVMDLVALGKNATLVPTPGQTEQEYLADWLREKGIFSSCRESDLTPGAILSSGNHDVKNFKPVMDDTILKTEIGLLKGSG